MLEAVLEIPVGARVYVGAPANQLPDTLLEKIRIAVSAEPHVVEAHLPQCYIPAVMPEPRQVLFVVYGELPWPPDVLSERLNRLSSLCGGIDIFPMSVGHELLEMIRGSGCRIWANK